MKKLRLTNEQLRAPEAIDQLITLHVDTTLNTLKNFLVLLDKAASDKASGTGAKEAMESLAIAVATVQIVLNQMVESVQIDKLINQKLQLIAVGTANPSDEQQNVKMTIKTAQDVLGEA